MSHRPGSTRWTLALLGGAAAAGALLVLWLRFHSARGPGAQPSPAESFPVPPYSESRFLNAGPDAQYIGTAACAECHPRNHRSYSLTSHSKALSDVNPKDEPPDGSFFHKASGRTYRVYRQGNQLRHQEIVRTAEGKEVARVDVPVRYVVGSGHIARTYLVESDGFLHESPITWYTLQNKWGMSPNYDSPRHWGFERPVTAACLTCHAGRIDPVGDTTHRITFREQAIGCENCHGPGSLHQALHRSKKHVPGEEDLTIVNPGKLDRPRLEDVCAACHLNPQATIPLRGREFTDYRPGRPLTDYRISYRFDGGDEQMTVGGHVEQTRQSACYKKSRDLTCVTCHDPHAPEKPKDRVAFYRDKCLNCHATQPCRLDEAKRLAKEPADNCVACHMPSGETGIPHLAFTHHRIGLHSPTRPGVSGRVPELVPTDDVSHLSQLDRQRNLGLAYLAALQNSADSRHSQVFRERARELLQIVHAAGLRDGETAAALAGLYWNEDRARAVGYAREAVEARGVSADVRARALALVAEGEIQEHNFEAATGMLEELVRRRRSAEDWRFLGMCYLEQGQTAQALSALRQAEAIRPYRHAIHRALAEVYRQLGKAELAQEHDDKGLWLFQHRQD